MHISYGYGANLYYSKPTLFNELIAGLSNLFIGSIIVQRGAQRKALYKHVQGFNFFSMPLPQLDQHRAHYSKNLPHHSFVYSFKTSISLSLNFISIHDFLPSNFIR
jgi:hypothetical protein